VAISIIALIGTVGVVAIMRYQVEGALKVWGVLGGITGVVTGAFVTYFFTRQPIEEAKLRAQIAERTVAQLQGELSSLHQTTTTVRDFLSAADNTVAWNQLASEPAVRTYIAKMDTSYGLSAETRIKFDTLPKKKN